MKPKIMLFTALFGITVMAVQGQLLKESSLPVSVLSSEDIFKQGVWNFNLNELISLQAGNTREDGVKTGTFSNLDGNIEANYFFIDHFGAGAGIGFTQDVTRVTEFDPEALEKINVLDGHFNFLYGNNIGGVVNIITKANVGLGSYTTINDFGYGEYETKYNYFKTGVSVGTPIEINRNVYFTPSAGYSYIRYKNDDFKEVCHGFNLELNMDFFMGCGDDMCDLSDNPLSLDSRFIQGDMVLGSRMFGNFQVGKQTTTYQGEGEVTQNDGFGNSRLSGYFLYYVMNNLAIGAGTDFSCNRTNSKDTEYKTKQSEATFYPVVRYNLPFDNMLKNIYTEGSFGFGFNNSKTEDGSGEVTDNASVINWRLGAGYTYFVSEHFSLSPVFGYGSQTLKYKNDDLKAANGGIYAGVGWNFHLR